MNKAYDAVVIGGGVIGTSCAYHMVKKGLSVALVEKKDIARGTSSHCDAAALIVDKQPGVDAALGYASIQRFKELTEELSYDFSFTNRGSMYVCESEQEMEIAAKYARDLSEDGYRVYALSPAELLEREPFLARDLVGGIYSDECCGLSPFKLCFAFVETVKGKELDVYPRTSVLDIKLNGRREVEAVETTEGTLLTKKVVNCCGVWAPEIGRMVGINIPIIPRKGVILISGASFPFCKQKVQEFGYMLSKFAIECKRDPLVEKYGVAFTIEPTEGNNVMVGSSRNFAGCGIDTELEIIETIAKRAVRFYPILKELNCIRSYAGVRPFMEDHLPLITDVQEVPGYYIAAGHEGDGISMAPSTGRLISELLAGEKPYLDITPFSYSRYSKK